jgi:hypothetical protein
MERKVCGRCTESKLVVEFRALRKHRSHFCRPCERMSRAAAKTRVSRKPPHRAIALREEVRMVPCAAAFPPGHPAWDEPLAPDGSTVKRRAG